MTTPVVLFIIGLLAFLFGFGGFIAYLSSRLSHRLSRRAFSVVEWIIILGIVLGSVGMFQPLTFGLFEASFLLLLVATLAYIVWSHITPRGEEAEEQETRITIY